MDFCLLNKRKSAYNENWLEKWKNRGSLDDIISSQF